MALERTWKTVANFGSSVSDQRPSTNAADVERWELWAIAQILMGQVGWPTGGVPAGTWEYYAGSDGTTSNTGGGSITNLWGGGTFTASKLVNAGPGTAHSWIVLKKDSFGDSSDAVYLTLDYSLGSTTQFVMVASKNAPTGGSTTNRPTSSNELVLSNTQQFNDNVFAHSHMVSLSLSSTGEWWAGEHYSGAAGFYAVCGLFPILDAKPEDDYPFALLRAGNGALATQLMIWNNTSWNSPSTNNVFFACLTADGSASTRAVAVAPAVHDPTASSGGSPFDLFGTVMSSPIYSGTDSADGKYGDFPIYVFSYAAPYRSLRGRLGDIRWCPATLPAGSVAPVLTPTITEYEVVSVGGRVWFPWTADVGPII